MKMRIQISHHAGAVRDESSRGVVNGSLFRGIFPLSKPLAKESA